MACCLCLMVTTTGKLQHVNVWSFRLLSWQWTVHANELYTVHRANYCTLYSTCFSLSVMPTCHALHNPCCLSFLKFMCYSPLYSPPKCAALGFPVTRRTNSCWSESSGESPRWTGRWSIWCVSELGLLSLEKKKLTRRDPSNVFRTFFLPSTPIFFFFFFFDGCILH